MDYLNPIPITLNTCLDILLGVSIGDAVGVPVEFKSREAIKNKPIKDMIGFGTYNLPPGTFSDDSSLTFCLAEALISGYNLNNIGDNFIKWLCDKYWTATNVVFDVGITTQNAIERLIKGFDPTVSGEFDEESNGNGSLMRILPLLLHIQNKPIAERYRVTRQVSSITHGHVRSSIACFYYLEFARGLLQGIDKFKIYKQLQTTVSNFLDGLSINPDEKYIFKRLLIDRIELIPIEKINSSGYVVSTLEASIWCLLTTENYQEAVLKAVNLGSDTDTTAAVTGGLAGLLYGHATIPANWVQQLARKDDVVDLASRLYNGLR
ncbi:MAG: ADP-ribosylglycohydrolase family protein [Mucilaginibacter sp.]|nr:ADP-ribosylglycohydrolase family protein [Mucilaginibacter sp.]